MSYSTVLGRALATRCGIRTVEKSCKNYLAVNRFSHRLLKKVPLRTKEHVRATFHVMKVTLDKSGREERGAIASQAISLTAHQILNPPGEPKRVTRAQLEESAPGLDWLLNSPEDCPLTAQAFQEVRESRKAFALRRIRWALQKYEGESIKPTRREFILRAKVKKTLDIPSVLDAIEAALT
jgi:hypothetical protein